MPAPEHDPAEWQRLSQQYRDYARFELAAHGSPIYAAICARLADDRAIGSLGLEAEAGFRTPLILLAAVHHLLLSGVEHPLAAYYPSLAGADARPIDDGLYPAFADLVVAHRKAVAELIATRTTQTNEARRTVLLVPPLGLIAEGAGAPIALLEVGASAGLNLLPDRYGFTIGADASGDRASPVQIACAVEGDLRPPVPDAVPPIGWRAGLDLHPLDVRSPDTVAWLRALIWPEHLDRMAILEGAVAVAAADPPRLVEGDLALDLPELAAEAPAGMRLVVTDTWVLAYVTPERRLDLVRALRRVAAERGQPLWLVSCEGQAVLASLELGIGEVPQDGSGGFSALSMHRFDPDGGSRHDLLAVCHAHGRWLRWLDPATAALARGDA
ncbi:MAG TPA: DUF2332 domain-containing protein [Candidatus Limnocylindria bacterium]